MSVISLEECELMNDSKYRAYITQVEKALKSFEYTSEWADLISALGKLNKVLVSHVKYPVIPRRVTIGKRLAQCLHPALPSGVHLKVLETYDIIFKCIGTQRLSADLFTYGAGLFPLLAYAAINVKPTLLSIYETHFVPLGRHIKPALAGVLLGLLPGLEEGSEFYARTTRILDDFCESVEASTFYGCLWECVVTCSNIRLAAITYVLAHYKRKLTMEDQLYIIGTSIDTMVEALCCSVQDSSVLVQRSALELLLAGFPVHNNQLTRPDMEKVMCAVVKVVLRRDMSLNRRLYAWLLGTDASGMPIQNHVRDDNTSLDTVSMCSESELAYFNAYSKELLVQGIRDCILESSGSDEVVDGKPASLRPFRILISLLDRPEIGPTLLEDVLLDVFRHMYRECVDTNDYKHSEPTYPAVQDNNNDKKRKHDDRVFKTEIIKTANLLFGAFEPYFIWEFIANTFESVCGRSSSNGDSGRRRTESNLSKRQHIQSSDIGLEELCFLVEFLLDKLTLEAYAETQTEHLPELLRRVTESLAKHCGYLVDRELNTCLKLCARILSRVLPSITPANQHATASQYMADTHMHTSESTLDSGVCVAQEAATYNYAQEHNSIQQHVDGATTSDSTDAFGEFVQYTADQRGANQSNVTAHTLMQSCVKSFQDLFCKLLETHIIKDTSHNASVLVKQLDVKPTAAQQLPKGLRELVYKDDITGRSNTTHNITGSHGSAQFAKPNEHILSIDKLSKDVYSALVSACQLLVDFSTFPMCVSHQHGAVSDSLASDAGSRMLPAWLEMLLLCCCYVDDFHLQHTAINTMLDLINLAQSVMSDANNDDAEDNDVGRDDISNMADDSRRRQSKTVSVVMVPSLSVRHLKYLQNDTRFYEVVAIRLWQYLGDKTPSHHQACVELLYQLHQVTPSPWTCEDVIGNSLLAEDKEERVAAHKRFAVLWHLLREKRYSATLDAHVRTFDRSLCVMLDSLQSDINPCRSLTQTWLTHAIQRGDIARIMEPMLLVLLHPDTARISIQHIRVEKSSKMNIKSSPKEGSEAHSSDTNIYAISSDRGNVVYHVSSSTTTSAKSSPAKSDKRTTFAVTSISKTSAATSATMTASTQNGVETDLSCDKVDPDEVNMRLNPFGASENSDSMEDLIFDGDQFPSNRGGENMDSVLKKATRLDADTCKKEGIYFDDVEQAEEAGECGGGGSVVDSLEKENGEARQSEKQNREVQQIEEDGEDESSDSDSGNTVLMGGDEGEAADVASWIINVILGEIFAPEREPIVLQTSLMEAESSEDIRDSSPDIDEGNSEQANHDQEPEDIIDGVVTRRITTQKSTDSRDTEVDNVSLCYTRTEDNSGANTSVHPLHTHVLLYTQKYDTERTLYALSVIKALVSSSPRLITCALSTTNISGVSTPHLLHFQDLIIRHRHSVLGKNFFSEVPMDASSGFNRSSMFLEVVVSICLYFTRSYYPDLMAAKLSSAELTGNKQVQILSCELLTLILSELVNLTKDSGKNFAVYVSDLFSRCKVQKALLHCLLASVHNNRPRNRTSPNNRGSFRHNVTEAIIYFNEDQMDRDTSDTFQTNLLKLILVLIILEDQIRFAKNEPDTNTQSTGTLTGLDLDRMRAPNIRFVANRPIVTQPMFLCAVLSALKQHNRTDMHRHWLAMVTTAMPYVGRSLANILVPVINQLCKNIEIVAELYELDNFSPIGQSTPSSIPADHIITMFESLTTISQYCLLDSNQQDISVGSTLATNPQNLVNDTAISSKIVYNLIHVFSATATGRESTPDKDIPTNLPSPILEARRSLLSILPRIIASLAALWKAVNISDQRYKFSGKEQVCWALGTPKVIKQCMMELLSPISLHHGANMLAAVAIVWNDRRVKSNVIIPTKVVPEACPDQHLLVDLVSAVRVLPTDTLIQTVKLVIKQPPPTTPDKHKKRVPLEVSMLQFFYLYIQRSYTQQTVQSWPALHSLLKEGLQLGLPPPGQFLLLAIFNEFVHKTTTFEDKKDQKDLQEICQRLLEACSEVAGSSLEQTTWLRRQLAVKPGPQLPPQVLAGHDDVTTDTDVGAVTDEDDIERSTNSRSSTSTITSANTNSTASAASKAASSTQVSARRASASSHTTDSNNVSNHDLISEAMHRQYSVQALMMLAQLVAPLLDVVYSSDEKDKVLPILTSIMCHVFPYLKNHSAHNLPSFRACCQLLASLSGYQYTRKTWRREAFEMLLDTSFFQVDIECLGYWAVIIDNLMTHDKTTFKDLLAKVTVVPSGSLNLFSSRDQEIEQRAQLLKRLSFVVYSSEVDQYHKAMPDIQERLVDSLRVPSVPTIQCHVFMCFRVLLLRMSSQQLTSLWPTIITELVHVLLQIEQELIDIEETKSQLARLGNLDASWALGNGLNNTRCSPNWLRLYLAASKLLDLALVLPQNMLPQFQLYRWAFMGDPGLEEDAPPQMRHREYNPKFTPHVLRIARVMGKKYGKNVALLHRRPGCPLLHIKSIRSLQDLYPFYATLASEIHSTLLTDDSAEENAVFSMPKSISMPDRLTLQGVESALTNNTASFKDERSSAANPRDYIERLVQNDFIESLPKS